MILTIKRIGIVFEMRKQNNIFFFPWAKLLFIPQIPKLLRDCLTNSYSTW